MRENPERMAWAVLATCFALFCVIAVAVPLGIRWYVQNAQMDQVAVVESIRGTVVIELPVGQGAVPLTSGQSYVVGEGATIKTDESSEAMVTLFEHSPMRIFPASVVSLLRLRSPRYESSHLPNQVHLDLAGGRIQVGTALSVDTPLSFLVTTLHADVALESDGSYALSTNNERGEFSVYRGLATVTNSHGEVRLEARERTLVELGVVPGPAVGVAQNWVANGDFAEGLDGWQLIHEQGADGGDVYGTAELTESEGRTAVRFVRTGGHGNHCETILEQTFDQKLPDPMTSLVIRATVKLQEQSLSGGGYLSSEYPLMIRLTYRDSEDHEGEWVQGFYYQNVDGNPTMYGLQIPHDRWYLFDSGNLLDSLPRRPYRIIRLRVYASGWDYDSMVSDVSMIVE